VQEAVQNLRNYNCQYGMFWYGPAPRPQAAPPREPGSRLTRSRSRGCARTRFDIEGPQYWNDVASNQAWLSEAVNQALSMGQTVGIYTSQYQWSSIMGSWSGASRFPLW
jgi:hypothetical protein